MKKVRKFSNKSIIILPVIGGLLSVGIIQAYADVPDSYQNDTSNNIAYDVSSKFYLGANIGYSLLNDSSITLPYQTTTLHDSSPAFGFFGGYKFNDYFSLEANLERLAVIRNNDSDASQVIPMSYHATVNNISIDGILSYPFITDYSYTESLYGSAGYGLNLTNYTYNLNDGSPPVSDSLRHSAYNLGLGVNLDFRSNISARLGYNYYRTYYPVLSDNDKHGTNVFTIGIYYNFA